MFGLIRIPPIFGLIRIGNRLVGIVGVYVIIRLSDRVQVARKLEHFVGSLPLNWPKVRPFCLHACIFIAM